MMCDGCMAPYSMGTMEDRSPIGHLGCSQSLAIVSSAIMNAWEQNHLIPRILILLMVNMFKMCYKVLLQRETPVTHMVRRAHIPSGT